MDLHLDDVEVSLLYRILKNRLADMRSEIHHDHDSESRRYMKHKEMILTNILAKFPERVDDTMHRRGFAEKA